jgi:hypothetical protein
LEENFFEIFSRVDEDDEVEDGAEVGDEARKFVRHLDQGDRI